MIILYECFTVNKDVIFKTKTTMETIIYQEILLAHSSKFFNKEFFCKETSPEYEHLSPKEQLAEACWNGVLREMLPELCSSLHMDQINEGNRFINVCMGDTEDRNNTCFSINPYFFLNHSRKN